MVNLEVVEAHPCISKQHKNENGLAADLNLALRFHCPWSITLHVHPNFLFRHSKALPDFQQIYNLAAQEVRLVKDTTTSSKRTPCRYLSKECHSNSQILKKRNMFWRDKTLKKTFKNSSDYSLRDLIRHHKNRVKILYLITIIS